MLIFSYVYGLEHLQTQHNTLQTMLKTCFLSNDVVLRFITTTPRFNNPLVNQHFSFPFSLTRFSTTTSASQSESITRPFAVSYLINNFGFTHESALKYFNNREVRFNTPDKPDSVITFFKNHGFSHSDILIIIKKAPWLLSSQPHNVILPKLQFFLSKDVSSSDIVSLLTANPSILRSSLDKRIIPLFELLSRFFKTDKDIIVCLIRYWSTFTTNVDHLIVSNINLMVDFGVSDSTLVRLLRTRPCIFGSTDLIKSLDEVKALGFDPSVTTFGVALIAKKGISKNLWDKKVDVYKKWGWSDEAVIRAFRRRPELLLISIDKINLVMSFWVNQMCWDSLALAKYPLMFGYSLHKRIIPRASVLQFLLMKGLREKNASLVTPFRYSEKLFLKKFVFRFKEESDYLLKLYEEKMKLAYAKENNCMPMPSTECVTC